jgi:hypothetical protein
MGGYGSGWQGSKKSTVEGSLVLTASSLVRKKALLPGARTSGSWAWTYDGEDRPHATIGYEADLTDQHNEASASSPEGRPAGGLQGPARDHRAELRGASVICPLVRRDGGPPRRVAKLYLPAGGKYFGSREGYGLTYTSCQESGKDRGLFRRLAAEMGTDEATVRAALRQERTL